MSRALQYLKWPDWRWHANALSRSIRRRLRAVVDAQARERFRRERFWKVAARYVEGLTVRDRFGNRVTVSTSDQWVSRGTFVAGAFEPTNLDNIVKILALRGYSPEQVVDVGANIGTSMLELLSVYPEARGVAIEPDPGNFSLLRQNLIANELEDRVQAINVAVADAHGEVPLSIHPTNPGEHRVGREYGSRVIMVTACRLAELIRTDCRTLVWMDVQGYEGHVLKGADGVGRVPVVAEFWPHGLKQTGGYAWFVEAVNRYPTMLEVRGSANPIQDIERLASRLEKDGEGTYADVLLLPWRLEG